MIPLVNVGSYLHLQPSNIYQAGKINPLKTWEGQVYLASKLQELMMLFNSFIRVLGLFYLFCKGIGATYVLMRKIKKPYPLDL